MYVIRHHGTLRIGGRVSGRSAVRGLEEASVKLAQKNGAKRVVFTVENFDNKEWGDWHFDQGYSRMDSGVFENLTGFKVEPGAMEYPGLFGKLIFVP